MPWPGPEDTVELSEKLLNRQYLGPGSSVREVPTRRSKIARTTMEKACYPRKQKTLAWPSIA